MLLVLGMAGMGCAGFVDESLLGAAWPLLVVLVLGVALATQKQPSAGCDTTPKARFAHLQATLSPLLGCETANKPLVRLRRLRSSPAALFTLASAIVANRWPDWALAHVVHFNVLLFFRATI